MQCVDQINVQCASIRAKLAAAEAKNKKKDEEEEEEEGSLEESVSGGVTEGGGNLTKQLSVKHAVDGDETNNNCTLKLKKMISSNRKGFPALGLEGQPLLAGNYRRPE